MTDIIKNPHSSAQLDVEYARAYLAECRDLEEIKLIRDNHDAFAHLLRAQRAGDDSAARASVIAREAERRGGELLKAMELGRVDRGGGGKPTDPAQSDGTSLGKRPESSPLKSLGLTPSDSRRMHAAASLDEDEWKAMAKTAIETKRPIPVTAPTTIVRRRRRIENMAEISKGNAELNIPQRFPVVLADPPWPIVPSSATKDQDRSRSVTGRRDEVKGNTRQTGCLTGRRDAHCLASIASDVLGLYPSEVRANRARGSVSAGPDTSNAGASAVKSEAAFATAGEA